MFATPRLAKMGMARSKRLRKWAVLIATGTALAAATVILLVARGSARPKLAPKPVARVLKQAEATAVLAGSQPTPKKHWHPPHKLKLWMAVHKGRTFRVIQLPRCEHLETIVAYAPQGQTLQQAKVRYGGIAACTGSFHNPKSMVLADFLQSKGQIVSCARTGRSFVAIHENGKFDISCDYSGVKGNKSVTALALGQRLVPLYRDGFSIAFMNKVTDRMAIGLNNSFIFIVQGKSDIWRLAHFMRTKLPVRSAINCDGGHVVRGKGPVHLVFRWKPTTHPGTSPNSPPTRRR